MPKKKSASTAITPVKSTSIPPVIRNAAVPFGDGLIRVDAIYNVPSVHPTSPGPWASEPDKIAWKDEASGLDCIIRRSPEGGHLAGYVAVPPEHPLFGIDKHAMIGLGINPHGGIDYSRLCDPHAIEAVAICHVATSFSAAVLRSQAGTGAKDHAHADAWWIGFECNRPYDAAPYSPLPTITGRSVSGINLPKYRDVLYVFAQTVRLAAQLSAFAVGIHPAIAVERNAILGYDHGQARSR